MRWITTMAVLVLAILGLSWGLWPVSLEAQGLTPQEIARKLQARYDDTTSMRADFRQVTSVPMSRRTREGAGRVAFRKPGRMRWDYTRPDAQVLVSDGQRVFLYFAKEKQMIVRPVDEYLKSDVTYGFFSGSGNLLKDFEIKAAEQQAGPSEYVVRLVPRKMHPQVDFLDVWVDRQGFVIKRLEIVDQFGSITRLFFSHIEINPRLPDALFRFSPPPGTERLEQ